MREKTYKKKRNQLLAQINRYRQVHPEVMADKTLENEIQELYREIENDKVSLDIAKQRWKQVRENICAAGKDATIKLKRKAEKKLIEEGLRQLDSFEKTHRIPYYVCPKCGHPRMTQDTIFIINTYPAQLHTVSFTCGECGFNYTVDRQCRYL